MAPLRIATWNVQWARPPARRGRVVRDRLGSLRADVLAVTEGFTSTLPSDGHWIAADADYGYGISERRKVLLWSRSAWRDVDTLGEPNLPSGRFVAGTTDIRGTALRVIGVCIPWRDAHVRSGRRDRVAWQDHLTYLAGLSVVIKSTTADYLVVAGDLNQRVPPRFAPQRCAEALESTLAALRLATAGDVQPLGKQLIDHVAHSPSLTATRVASFSRTDVDGTRLSDHDGVVVELARFV